MISHSFALGVLPKSSVATDSILIFLLFRNSQEHHDLCWYRMFPQCLVIPASEGKQEWERNWHLTSQMIAATVSMAGLPFLIPAAFCSFVSSGSVWRLCYSCDCWKGDHFHKRWEGKEREVEDGTTDGFFLFFLPYWQPQVWGILLSLLKDGY